MKTRPRLAPVAPPALVTAEARIDSDTLVQFEFHRVARRKNTHLLVTQDGVVQVRAPVWLSLAGAQEQIRKHADWVLAQQQKIRREQRRRPALQDGSVLPFLEEQLRLRMHTQAQMSLPLSHVEARKNRALGWVERRGDELWLQSAQIAQENIGVLLESWYRGQARRVLGERLQPYAERLALWPARIRIASQRTRWGSCSSRGTISLNWRLLLLPVRLADYVLVHELCHLQHLNHSRDFWALVATIEPDYQGCRKRLRALQADLPF